MPKKSNKTAHVLSLLTNGSGELNDSTSHEKGDNHLASIPSTEEKSASPSTVVVEIQGEPKDDLLSDLVKQELEQELIKQEQLTSLQNQEMSPVEEDAEIELTEESLTESDEIKIEEIVSEKFVLEEFDEEENPEMPTKLNMINDYEPSCANDSKILHNLAEDVIRAKVPDVMKSFNMCTCQNCTYDVMAFALNHVAPLYTVTDKGHLYQKLSSYETQYGADLTSAITKACIRVKINPNHVNSNSD
ncbi:late competence development ComFB family protein [Clostridium aminobutyricum]|uniref:Late competence development ComFB family protein n=1 Tax=Clostridium aminobutyricum TaxID=33953 RepID=A0A939D967_CLOAM|nr:late competence development ComFB family protein [Clostridium aminobutyricum]MBN7773719.1 late competence development ComFB family protein [Clostridium aminobutyricum]